MSAAGATVKKVRINGLTGINMNAVNEEHLRKVAAELQLPADANEVVDPMLHPLEPLVIRVAMHLDSTTAKSDRLQCDTCLGYSPNSLDACPFCGSVDDSPAQKTAPAKQDLKPEAPPAAAPANKKPAGKKEEAQVMGKAATAEKADKATTTEKPATSAKKGAKVTSIVRDDTKPSSEIVTERELDTKVKRILDLKGATAVSYWHLGIAIKDLFDSQAWKQRNGEDGKPKYKGFDAFVHHELKMTPQNAYKIMDTAKTYTEDQVRAFGHTKLGLLLEAPAEDRERILKEVVERGGSKREVEKEVRRVRKEKGHRKEVSRSGKKLPKDKGPRGQKKQTITVANMIGRKQIKLFAKPAGYKLGADLKDAKRAKRIADVPFGVNDLENDVKQFYTLQEGPTGELILVVETKRID
jgi:hypothetical protein